MLRFFANSLSAVAVVSMLACQTTAPSQCGNDDSTCLDGSESSGGSSSGSAESSTGEESGSTSDEMTGSTSTGPMPCIDHDECNDGAAPFCDPAVGECVSCDQLADGNGNEACADADAMAPLCIGAECVACDPKGDSSVCDAQLLVCGDGNACGPCTEHGQCDSGACDIAGGTCFDPANVLDVGMDQMYTTIAHALGEVATSKLDNAVLRLHEGTDFNEVATVDTGAVAFIAADGQSPQWVYTAMPAAPTLTVSGNDTRVYLAGIRLSVNSNDIGLLVDGATVDVRRSRIVQNSGGGIVAQGGATLTVENCFVGGAVSDVDAIAIAESTINMLYTTVGAGPVIGDRSRALVCVDAVEANVRNSILLSADPMAEVECGGANLTTSALEANAGGFDIGWFVNYASGDFGLTGSGGPIFEDIAAWQDGDPTTDIDGDARPNTDGAMDYAGADVPSPR